MSRGHIRKALALWLFQWRSSLPGISWDHGGWQQVLREGNSCFELREGSTTSKVSKMKRTTFWFFFNFSTAQFCQFFSSSAQIIFCSLLSLLSFSVFSLKKVSRDWDMDLEKLCLKARLIEAKINCPKVSQGSECPNPGSTITLLPIK